jgi:hypothetical protein
MKPNAWRTAARAVACGCLLAVAQAADAGESTGGKWTPEQLLEHDPAWLQGLGLEIPAAELWDGAGGLLEAVVQVGGCSSGFVSPEGLLVTNHHCAFGLLQQHSSPDRDLIRDGFLAAERGEELPGTGTRASIPHRFEDVTARIKAAVPEGADDLQRYQAIDREKKEIVADCEARESRRCKVAVYDDGVRYTLVEALEYPDVRLVYAPPRAVGEFGGEVDNWMWPRHTGDFALLRVYATERNDPASHADDNVPYRPDRHLQIAREGVADGSFVMVVGYPGRTYRRLVAAEMEERFSLYFPRRAELYRTWIDLMETQGAGDEAVRITLASRVKGLANREKNSRGQVVGIERGDLLAKKRRAESEVLAWARERPEHQAAVEAYDELTALDSAARATWERDFLLDQIEAGTLPLGHAIQLVRWAREAEKPDLERPLEFQQRNRTRARERLERDQTRLHLPTEQLLLLDLLERFSKLDPDERPGAFAPLLAAAAEDRQQRVEELVEGSRVTVLGERLKMFEESAAELAARHDPLLDLAQQLVEEVIEPQQTRDERNRGAVSRLRPVWRRAVAAHAGRPVDPDANGTLRVSLARVGGYRPRDGVWMTPVTRLAGVVEKHTGEEPFDAPDEILEGAAGAGGSRWADAALGDVPICFLASGDTTGGSSGSPVLNGKGELVGVNFDRVWENIANDFGYNPEIARNITADVRYLLWLLESARTSGSGRLLTELGVDAVAPVAP